MYYNSKNEDQDDSGTFNSFGIDLNIYVVLGYYILPIVENDKLSRSDINIIWLGLHSYSKARKGEEKCIFMSF